jgi:hypothetical protein
MFQHDITYYRTLFTFQGTLNLPFSTYDSVISSITSPRTDTRRTFLIYKPGVVVPGSTFKYFLPGTGYEINCYANFTITVPSPEYQLPYNVDVFGGSGGNIGNNYVTFRKDIAPIPISQYNNFINIVYRVNPFQYPTNPYQNYRPGFTSVGFTTFDPGSSYFIQAKSSFTVNSTLPTPTPTKTPSPTPTKTPTQTPTITPSESPQITPSPTRTLTPSPTLTYTRTPSPTPTPRSVFDNGDLFVLGVYRSSAENRTYIWIRDKDTYEIKKREVDIGYYSGEPTPIIRCGPAKAKPYIFYIANNQMHVVRFDIAPKTPSKPYGEQDDVIYTLATGEGFNLLKLRIHKNQGVDMVWLCIMTSTNNGTASTQKFICINLATLQVFNTLTVASQKAYYYATNTKTLYPAYIYYNGSSYCYSEYNGSSWTNEPFVNPGKTWPYSCLLNFNWNSKTSDALIQFWCFSSGCTHDLYRRDGVNSFSKILSICGGLDNWVGWRGGIFTDALDGSLYMVNNKSYPFPSSRGGDYCSCTGRTSMFGRISYSGDGSVWTHNNSFLYSNTNVDETAIYPHDKYSNDKTTASEARWTNSYDGGMYGVRTRVLDTAVNNEYYLDYIINGNILESELLDTQLVAGTVAYNFSICSNVSGA